jgi:hypothetical protein
VLRKQRLYLRFQLGYFRLYLTPCASQSLKNSIRLGFEGFPFVSKVSLEILAVLE